MFASSETMKTILTIKIFITSLKLIWLMPHSFIVKKTGRLASPDLHVELIQAHCGLPMYCYCYVIIIIKSLQNRGLNPTFSN